MTKFYQDPNDRMVRGVCAGIARGFGIDPIWVRGFFALMLILGLVTAGVSALAVVFVYAVLALLMPTIETKKDGG